MGNRLIQTFDGVERPVAPALMSERFTVTLAQVNAGHIIIPVSNTVRKMRVVNFVAIPNGAFAALTLIRLITTDSTPVVIATFAQAQLTDDAVLVPGATGVVLEAGFQVDGAAGQGVKVDKTGSAGTTATDIKFEITYQFSSLN